MIMFQWIYVTSCMLLSVSTLDGKNVRNLHTVAAEECTASEFKCGTTNRCVFKWEVCDGYDHCGDNSDEPEDCLRDGVLDEALNAYNLPEKCPTSSRKIATELFCDGFNDCRDASDESVDRCEPVTCQEDEWKCRTTNLCVPTGLLCDGYNNCGDNSDETDDCPSKKCGKHEVACGATNRCIYENNVCNGYDDCGDNSDEPEDCPPVNCKVHEFKCGTTNRCVNIRAVCNGFDDCGDNSDEPEDCPPVKCNDSQFKCTTTNRCVSFDALCNGHDDCGDNSDEPAYCLLDCSPGYVKCPQSRRCILSKLVCDGVAHCDGGTDEPDTCPNSTMLSVEESQCFSALRHMSNTCGEVPIQLDVTPSGELRDLRRIFHETLIQTDLRKLCRQTQTWFECHQNQFSKCANVDDPMGSMRKIKLLMSIGEFSINYVCNQHIEVFSRNKACLLRGEYSEEDGMVAYELFESLLRNCPAMYNYPPRRRLCTPDAPEILDCAKNVITAQCGEEVADALIRLATNMYQNILRCPLPRERELSYS